MRVRIAIVKGKDAGEHHDFELASGGCIRIGRGAECDLSIWDEAASRVHLTIEHNSNGELYATDQDSSNGTSFQGKEFSSMPLSGGEQLCIGETLLRIETPSFQDRPTAVQQSNSTEEFKIEKSLAREAIDLGARFAKDAGYSSRLNILLEFVEEAQALTSGEKILHKLLERSKKALAVKQACIIPVASGTQEALWKEAFSLSPTSSLLYSKSLVENVLRGGNALKVGDVRSDPRTRESESLVSRLVESILAIPVSGKGNCHAVLYLEAAKGNGFEAEDLEYAATLGQIAGMALQNAEIVQQSKRIMSHQQAAVSNEILTDDEGLKTALDLVARFASSGGPLLITGETGTGKELMARHAHRNGPHRLGPWIPLNCAAIPSSLLESELFGHEKGAFTGATDRKAGMFEMAHEGTLFLDEIGDMPLELQAKLLRVLESGQFYRIGGSKPVKVNLMVVSATHHSLEKLVAKQEFREDLFYRLTRFQVSIPALRNRPADIQLLATSFAKEAAKRQGNEHKDFSQCAKMALGTYSWPGNVRELKNVIERAVLLSDDTQVTAKELMLTNSTTSPNLSQDPQSDPQGPPPSLEEVEKRAIQEAMIYTGGKKGEAAELLAIAWPTLRRKLKKYGLE